MPFLGITLPVFLFLIHKGLNYQNPPIYVYTCVCKELCVCILFITDTLGWQIVTSINS